MGGLDRWVALLLPLHHQFSHRGLLDPGRKAGPPSEIEREGERWGEEEGKEGGRKRWSWERSGRSVSEMDGLDVIGVASAQPGVSRAREGRVGSHMSGGLQEESGADGINQGVEDRKGGLTEEGWR